VDNTAEFQEELSSIISHAVQQQGAPRAEAMKAIGELLSNPPRSLVEMIEAASVDVRQVQGGDEAHRNQFAALLDEAIEKFGESTREEQYAISVTLHPRHPLSPNRGCDAHTRGETSP
jgi:hypothetical protein